MVQYVALLFSGFNFGFHLQDPKQRGTTLPTQHTSKETDSRQSDEEPVMSLWVSGLPVTTKAADLKEIFGKFGEVRSLLFINTSTVYDSFKTRF